MILTKCHIENFGKFTDYDCEFTEGFNVINQPNGWGKTTLSIFIKAMFFGLKSTRVTSLEENDRKLYQPAGNGKYGGYVEFLKDGVKYRLERYFGQNERLDTCKLIDLSTGNSYEESDKKWGERLFTVNSDAFLRTLFLSQKDIDLSDNQSIADKIGNVYQEVGADDIDLALKNLDEKATFLKHKRGKGGLIDEKKERALLIDRAIKECEEAVLGVKAIEQSIVENEKQVEAFEKEINAVSNLSKKVREVSAIKERRKDYEIKCADREKTTKELDDLLYVVKDADATINDVSSYTVKIAEVNSLISERERVLVEINAKKQAKTEILANYKLEPKESDYREFSALKNEYNALGIAQEVESLPTATAQKKNVLPLVGLIIAIILIATGVVLAFSSLILGVVIALIGFVGAVVFLVLFISDMLKRNTEKIALMTKNGAQDERVIESQKTAIYSKMLLIKGRLGVEELSDETFLNTISNDLEDLSKLNAGLEHSKSVIESLERKIVTETEKVNQFISVFNLPIEYNNKTNSEKLAFLTTIMRDINTLEDKKTRLDKEILLIFERGIELSPELEQYDANVLDKKEKELNNSLKEKVEELHKLKTSRANCYLMQEKLSEYEQEKVSVEDDIMNLERQLKIVLKTRELLSGARIDLTTKFLKPITDGVAYYLKQFTGEDCNIRVDSNYMVQYELNGEYKSIDYCSRGWKNLYSLALRFAFIDAVYKKDEDRKINPFIILDDPFVNYDVEHIQNSLKVLKDLAKNRQIIYFVCHNSRV